VLRRVAKFAVVASVVAPGFSRDIGDQHVERWASAGGVTSLIQAAWTEGEAAERQITVSDRDVEDATAAPHDGLTQADRRYEARISLLNAALRQPILQAAAQSVTQEQIDAYVQAHPKFVPERRTIRMISAPTTRAAQQIKAAIARGLTWKAAARRFDASGVERITVDAVVVDDDLYAAVGKARPNRTTRFRRTVFRVTSIRPARPLPIDQQKAQAWELLAGEAEQKATTEFEGAMKAKWRPRTTCVSPASAKDFCSNSPTG
jgi:hypothetical protein